MDEIANKSDPDRDGRGSTLAGLTSTVVLTICFIYFISVSFAVPYFNFRYAKNHGFMSWVLFGEVVATAQAFKWPYYAINAKRRPTFTDAEKQNLEHYHRSCDAVRQAQRILNSVPPNQFTELKPEESDAYFSLYKIALNEAKLVDADVLAKVHPDLPTHFRDEYVASIELLNRSLADGGSFADQKRSHELWEQWVDWFNPNRSDMWMPKPPK